MARPHSQTRISVAAVIYQGQQVLLAKRTMEGSMAGRWELPGGKAEGNESPEQALIREMDEEFGITVNLGEVLARDSFVHKDVDHQLLAYRVETDMTGAELREHLEWAFFEPGALPPRDQIVDSDARILKKIGFLSE